MMLSGVDGYGKIGIVLKSACPCSVQRDPRHASSEAVARPELLNKINQGLAGLRLRQNLAGRILLHGELDTFGTASSCSRFRLVLRKHGACKKQYEEKDSHYESPLSLLVRPHFMRYGYCL